MLALVVLLVGGGLTFLVAHQYKRDWARSGQRLQFGTEYQIELALEHSPVILFYETANDSASSGDVNVTVYDPFDERMNRLPTGPEEESFAIGGWYGYPAREIVVDEPGPYRIKCANVAYGSDREVPPDDCVVLLKQPPRTSDMLTNYRVILVVGASITVALTVVLYVAHGITLNRRQGTRS